MTNKRFYVYVFKTPIRLTVKGVSILPGEIFYVGKGTGKRMKRHLSDKRRYNAIKSMIFDRIRGTGNEIISEKICGGLTEEESYTLEREMIMYYGKIINRDGVLCNIDNGGKGGVSGRPCSDAMRKILSEVHSGKIPWNKGKKMTGYDNLGRKKGSGWGEEERANHMKARSVEGYYDRWKTPEFSKKVSDSLVGRKSSSEGKIWYNDGTRETYCFEGDELPGFVKGRTHRQGVNNGKRFYNNGDVERFFIPGEEKEGFVLGRIYKKHK